MFLRKNVISVGVLRFRYNYAEWLQMDDVRYLKWRVYMAGYLCSLSYVEAAAVFACSTDRSDSTSGWSLFMESKNAIA